jgi:hypothetical protein
MASGYVNRVKRPNTWLHRPMLQNVKKALANPEPSTHDPYRKSPLDEPLLSCRKIIGVQNVCCTKPLRGRAKAIATMPAAMAI